MPLLKGTSPDTIRTNFKELRKSGMKESQAWAVALKHSRKGTGKKSIAEKVLAADPLKIKGS